MSDLNPEPYFENRQFSNTGRGGRRANCGRKKGKPDKTVDLVKYKRLLDNQEMTGDTVELIAKQLGVSARTLVRRYKEAKAKENERFGCRDSA